MYILSIDVGVKNLALYIENFNKDIVASCSTIDEVCCTGKTIFLARLDLYKEGECKCKIPDIVYERFINFFKLYSKYISECDCVIIEEQMYAFNKIAPQMGSMIKMYFALTYPNIPVIFVSPKIKTRLLGADKKIKDKHLKKWVDEKINDFMEKRKDSAIDFVRSKNSYDGHIYVEKEILECEVAGNNKKTNDYADAICQLQAFKYSCFILKKL
jgi:hypothetical protein